MTDTSKMRSEFEAWAKNEGFLLRLDYSGRYKTPSTRWAWQAWQASRQAVVVELPG